MRTINMQQITNRQIAERTHCQISTIYACFYGETNSHANQQMFITRYRNINVSYADLHGKYIIVGIVCHHLMRRTGITATISLKIFPKQYRVMYIIRIARNITLVHSRLAICGCRVPSPPPRDSASISLKVIKDA